MIDASRLWPRDRTEATSFKSGALSCLHRFNTPQASLADQPFSDGDESCHLVYDGRLDNRTDLAAELGHRLSESTTDEELLLAAYARFGADMPSKLIGDFALAIYDPSDNVLFLARDHLGVRPLYIAQSETCFAFASNKPALLALPWVDSSPNDQWLADTLSLTITGDGDSAYQGILTLQPAHWLRVKDGREEIRRYWQLEPGREAAPATDEAYVERFKALLTQSVECRLRSCGPSACELSGGLDSASIAALAAKSLALRGERLPAYSHLLPPELNRTDLPIVDEKRWIDPLLALQPNIAHHPVYSRDLGIVAALERSVATHAGLARDDMVTFSEELFQSLRRNDIRTLLSGYGGDQLVTGHGTGWQEELVKSRSWAGVWHEVCARSKHFRGRVRGLLSILKHGYFKRTFPSWNKQLLRTAINPAFAEANRYPKRYYEYPIRPRRGSVRERECAVIQSAEIVHRIEHSAVSAATYGVEYRYPLLDIRLLEFCLSLPTNQKMRNGMRRRMIRLATVGILPDALRLRDDKSINAVPALPHRMVRDSGELRLLLEQFRREGALARYVSIDSLDSFLDQIAAGWDGTNACILPRCLMTSLCLGLWMRGNRQPGSIDQVEVGSSAIRQSKGG